MAGRSSRGAYFLASDSSLDLAIAFLESFRRSNPKLPLCLIPFDSSIAKLKRLSGRYRFSVFSKSRVLEECDRISRKFHGQPMGHYRKLAMWEGSFREFVYFDIDSVVLEDVTFIWPWLKIYDFIASQSNIPKNVRYVWKKTIRNARTLSPQQIAYSASTGFIASRKNTLSLRSATEKLPEAIALSRHMALEYKEQPFLNYLACDFRASSLNLIAGQNPDLDIPTERWAGSRIDSHSNGRLRSRKPRVLFVHWAGLWIGGAHLKDPLWRHYRDCFSG